MSEYSLHILKVMYIKKNLSYVSGFKNQKDTPCSAVRRGSNGVMSENWSPQTITTKKDIGFLNGWYLNFNHFRDARATYIFYFFKNHTAIILRINF